MFTPIRLISIENEWDKFGWVGSPRCERIRAMERHLIDRRSDCVIVAGIEDPNANYSYDESAVVRLDGEYFLVQTSGCSCPSPSETWQVVLKGTLQDIREAIQRGDYGGYTLPEAELSAFLADIEAAGR